MLSYVDRVQLVVDDRRAAVDTWRALFGAEVECDDRSRPLGAARSTVRAGATLFEFLEPDVEDGPAAAFAGHWGQGLYGVGFSTPDLDALRRRLEASGVACQDDAGRLVLDSAATHGMPTTIGPDRDRAPVGHIRFAYEVTNVVEDWQATAGAYARLFGLDASKFCPIASHQYGYEGTLTLFDPPHRLDRVEITQTSGDGAMARFFQRRGPSLYMCYTETDDVEALAARLAERGCRFAFSEERDHSVGLFIHPSALHGMLMGVSLTNYAWSWSGHPELAGPRARGRTAH